MAKKRLNFFWNFKQQNNLKKFWKKKTNKFQIIWRKTLNFQSTRSENYFEFSKFSNLLDRKFRVTQSNLKKLWLFSESVWFTWIFFGISLNYSVVSQMEKKWKNYICKIYDKVYKIYIFQKLYIQNIIFLFYFMKM